MTPPQIQWYVMGYSNSANELVVDDLRIEGVDDATVRIHWNLDVYMGEPLEITSHQLDFINSRLATPITLQDPDRSWYLEPIDENFGH